MSKKPEIARLFQRLNDKELTRRAVQVVAFGDSVTQGAMEMGRTSPNETYHRLLHHDLENFYPASTVNMINSGISGETATQALNRLDRDVLRYDPDLVLVAFGLNDATDGLEALPAFRQAIGAIIQKIRRATQAAVIVVTPPFMAAQRNPRIYSLHDAVADRIIATQTQGILRKFAGALRDLAAEENVILADVHAAWERLHAQGLDTDTWLANGLNHPDARGHR